MRTKERDKGRLIELCRIMPGDEVRVGGEWLDVVDVRQQPLTQEVIVTMDAGEVGAEPRVFIGGLFTVRRVRQHAPLKPTVSHKKES